MNLDDGGGYQPSFLGPAGGRQPRAGRRAAASSAATEASGAIGGGFGGGADIFNFNISPVPSAVEGCSDSQDSSHTSTTATPSNVTSSRNSNSNSNSNSNNAIKEDKNVGFLAAPAPGSSDDGPGLSDGYQPSNFGQRRARRGAPGGLLLQAGLGAQAAAAPAAAADPTNGAASGNSRAAGGLLAMLGDGPAIHQTGAQGEGGDEVGDVGGKGAKSNTGLQRLIDGVNQQWGEKKRDATPPPVSEHEELAHPGPGEEGPGRFTSGGGEGGFKFKFGQKKVAAAESSAVQVSDGRGHQTAIAAGAASCDDGSASNAGPVTRQQVRASAEKQQQQQQQQQQGINETECSPSPTLLSSPAPSPSPSYAQSNKAGSQTPPLAGRRAAPASMMQKNSRLAALEAELASLGEMREELEGGGRVSAPPDTDRSHHNHNKNNHGAAARERGRGVPGRASSCCDRRSGGIFGGEERPGDVARLQRQVDDLKRVNERLKAQVDQSSFDEVQRARNLAAERKIQVERLEKQNASLEQLNRKLSRGKPGEVRGQDPNLAQKLATVCEELRISKAREKKLREIHHEFEGQLAKLHERCVDSEAQLRAARERDKAGADSERVEKMRALAEEKDRVIAKLEKDVIVLKKALESAQRRQQQQRGRGGMGGQRGRGDHPGDGEGNSVDQSNAGGGEEYADDFEGSSMLEEDVIGKMPKTPARKEGQEGGGRRGGRVPLARRDANLRQAR